MPQAHGGQCACVPLRSCFAFFCLHDVHLDLLALESSSSKSNCSCSTLKTDPLQWFFGWSAHRCLRLKVQIVKVLRRLQFNKIFMNEMKDKLTRWGDLCCARSILVLSKVGTTWSSSLRSSATELAHWPTSGLKNRKIYQPWKCCHKRGRNTYNRIGSKDTVLVKR